jgi:DUF4097 and DUF4098 domain-containing protein YvlB
MRVSAFLLLVCLVIGCENDVAPRFTAEEPLDLESEVTTQTSFRLENINGAISITGSATASGIAVTGKRRTVADTQEEADDRISDILVTLTATPDEVLLKTDHPEGGPRVTYAVDVSVVMPLGMAVSILNGNGPVDLDGATGGVVVTTGNGAVTARDVLGDMRLTTGNGGISGRVTLLSGSTVRADAGNGNIELRIPQSTSALVDAAVGNGMIVVSGLALSEKVQGQSTLTGRLGDGDGSIVLRSGNGNITLAGT